MRGVSLHHHAVNSVGVCIVAAEAVVGLYLDGDAATLGHRTRYLKDQPPVTEAVTRRVLAVPGLYDGVRYHTLRVRDGEFSRSFNASDRDARLGNGKRVCERRRLACVPVDAGPGYMELFSSKPGVDTALYQGHKATLPERKSHRFVAGGTFYLVRLLDRE